MVLATSQVAATQFGPESFSKHPAVAVATAETARTTATIEGPRPILSIGLRLAAGSQTVKPR